MAEHPSPPFKKKGFFPPFLGFCGPPPPPPPPVFFFFLGFFIFMGVANVFATERRRSAASIFKWGWGFWDAPVFLGIYCRIEPLRFSFAPLSRLRQGRAKQKSASSAPLGFQ